MAPLEVVEKMAEDRNSKGQFISGHPGGPGRPKGRSEKYRLRIEPHMPEIIDKLVELAKEGDLVAAKLILERLYPAHTAQLEELTGQVDELRELVATYEYRAAA